MLATVDEVARESFRFTSAAENEIELGVSGLRCEIDYIAEMEAKSSSRVISVGLQGNHSVAAHLWVILPRLPQGKLKL